MGIKKENCHENNALVVFINAGFSDDYGKRQYWFANSFPTVSEDES